MDRLRSRPAPASSALRSRYSQILAGTARTEGFEAQVQGYVARNWLVLAGFTCLDASILSSPNGDRGSPLQNAPRNDLRLFSAIDLTDGLTVGGAVSYSSGRVRGRIADPNACRQQVPGYWSPSALARYRFASRIKLQVNINNIADGRFYDGLEDDHVNISAGRSALLSVILQR
jgi:catecholate siderophore receptor